MLERFHARNQQQLRSYKQRLPQVLIVSGLSAPARRGAVDWLLESLQKNSDAFLSVDTDKTSISIEQVRQLYPRLYRRKPGSSLLAVHVNEAHRLTLPAQNALLKLLEEPPQHVRIILSAHRADMLLPTIRSRSQHLELIPVDSKQFQELLRGQTETRQLETLTGLDPWLAEAISGDAAQNDVALLSKRLLQEPLGVALLEVGEIAKDRIKLDLLLVTLGRIAYTGLKQAQTTTQQQQWCQRLSTVVEALEYTQSTNNPKLALDKLLLEFRSA